MLEILNKEEFTIVYVVCTRVYIYIDNVWKNIGGISIILFELQECDYNEHILIL